MSDPTPSSPTTLEFDRPHEVWVVERPRQRYWLHALLLVLTVFTTLVVGARMQDNFDDGRSVFALDENSLPWFPVGWVRGF